MNSTKPARTPKLKIRAASDVRVGDRLGICDQAVTSVEKSGGDIIVLRGDIRTTYPATAELRVVR